MSDLLHVARRSVGGCLLSVAVIGVFGCGPQDRAAKPTGSWQEIAAGAAGGVEVTAWETGSTKAGFVCMSLSIVPEPSARLPRDDELDTYKGRDPSCVPVPSEVDPPFVMWFGTGDRFGLLVLLLDDGVAASLELEGGEVVRNAIVDDTSPVVDLFVGVFAASGRPRALRLASAEGERTCRLETTIAVPDVICARSTTP